MSDLALRVSNRRGAVSSPKRLPSATLPRWPGSAPGHLARTTPGALVTLAAVQGGAGVSSATLLLATAVAAASEKASLAMDGARLTGGGLSALVGMSSQASAQDTALMVYEGTPLARPYVTTADGVHVVGGPPALSAATGTVGDALLADVAEALAACDDDAGLAALCRRALADRQLEDFYAPGADALARFLSSARSPHSLIALDLGVADAPTLRRHGGSSDLHVWVLAARTQELPCLAARLAAQPGIGRREAIIAWIPPGHAVRTRALRQLSALRGCPVVRMPTYHQSLDWGDRASMCRGSLETLCSLLP